MYSLVPVPEQLDGLTFCGLLLRCGENVADIGVGAVVGIEAVAAFDETVEFCLEQGEVPDACTHVGELAVDQYRHMRAGDVAVVAEIDDGELPSDRVPEWLDVLEDVTRDERWTGAGLAR